MRQENLNVTPEEPPQAGCFDVNLTLLLSAIFLSEVVTGFLQSRVIPCSRYITSVTDAARFLPLTLFSNPEQNR